MLILYSYCSSGLLSGKFKRGETPDPSDSRVGWVEQDKGKRVTQASPSLSQYADKEDFWELLGCMETIAKETGVLHIIPTLNSGFPPWMQLNDWIIQIIYGVQWTLLIRTLSGPAVLSFVERLSSFGGDFL